MKKIILITIATIIFSNPVYAGTNETQILDQLIYLTQKKEPNKAREYLTISSYDLFDRLYKHDLIHLIPSQVTEIKQQTQGDYNYIWVAKSEKPESTSVLAFQTEDDLLKLDLPETFRVGLGKDWPNKLNMIEQSYLLSKKYYGEEKSKEILEALLKQ